MIPKDCKRIAEVDFPIATVSKHALKEKSVRFAHEMRKADTDEVAASTTLVGVHLDTLARRACAFPECVREKGAMLLAQVDSLDATLLRQANVVSA